MLKKNIRTDAPIEITVGDVKFHLLRIGSNEINIGIDAPRDMRIDYPLGKSAAVKDGGQSQDGDIAGISQ